MSISLQLKILRKLRRFKTLPNTDAIVDADIDNYIDTLYIPYNFERP